MKTILCFGDSNTFGFNPDFTGPEDRRFGLEVRWPMAMQALLGREYHVVEEGLGSRTTVFDDPTSPGRRGIDHLPICLQSHQPLDLLILMLGTNDVKPCFSASAGMIASGMALLLQAALQPYATAMGGVPELLLVAPAPVGEGVCDSWLNGIFDMSSVETSRKLAGEYAGLAGEYGVHFMDAGRVTAPAAAEGVHLDAGAHGALAAAMAAMVREILE